jgi:DNA-binding transcriptional ArsR family regulator
LKILRDLDIVCFRTQDNKVFYKLKKKNVLDLIRYTENLFSRV